MTPLKTYHLKTCAIAKTLGQFIEHVIPENPNQKASKKHV
jgi:hypothetical protein